MYLELMVLNGHNCGECMWGGGTKTVIIPAPNESSTWGPTPLTGFTWGPWGPNLLTRGPEDPETPKVLILLKCSLAFGRTYAGIGRCFFLAELKSLEYE